MDDVRFDCLAKHVASRRSFVAGIFAALAPVRLDLPAAAQPTSCRRVNTPCNARHRCCSGLICSGPHGRRSGHCKWQQCRLGVTTCRGDRACCSGLCVDLHTDPANCGACGRGCLASESCVAGTCLGPCRSGLTLCDGVCVETLFDRNHCGSCTRSCPPGTPCCAGECANLATDARNCGACSQACPAGQACCNRVCTDLLSDPANCGACGTSCGGGTCRGGQCAACSADQFYSCSSLTGECGCCPNGANEFCSARAGCCSPPTHCATGEFDIACYDAG